ncbi:Energy-coupling factor transporter transmembrane protein EcfT [Lentibacillus sp. JNUCC-1]|uniref:energy-coupling factor transporter transmembrane component T family protein n=1 Tax=Lentibacillus sp. JNUCC-1 TaxID=2654513 RepID=UPI0012E78137|nr:energy-coupling factor transporter transmembrane protein EcfT [Lentibacillus sp. JNUCC-1]MUV38114.1 Energy-coupling factor transporter transmembrane protein EcfT [Lentibacillus sp. JNUCC-1]
MNNTLIIGQYVPGQSLVHKLDPRTKIMVIFFFVFIVFLANSAPSYSILAAFAIGATLITRIPLRFIFKGLTPIWFLIGFTFILHLIITKEGTVLIDIFSFKIYSGGLIQGFAISLRFFLLILVTSLLTLTTTPIEITDAIETLLNPLKKVKFPVHELALMMSISLRFIPTLMQETDKISKAQASRGVDFRTGPIKERAKAVVPLLVPLFVSAFKRAEDLAMAMEARGYHGGEGRTKLRILKISSRDYVAFGVFIIALAGLFLTRHYS